MAEETIVPFASAAAKRANAAVVERMKVAAAQAAEDGDPNIDAVTQILAAMEGMQTQVQALTDIVIDQDRRIQVLEKAAKSKIIKVMP